jgi:ferredoxin
MGRCSLLDLLLHAKANVPFQCKQGYCGCCRTKLASGEVRYTEDNMTFLKEGEILPCICQPVTDVEVYA